MLSVETDLLKSKAVHSNGNGKHTRRAVEYFGKNTFNDEVMREKLPKDVYKKLRATIRKGVKLDKDVANTVAHAMKEWAIEHGVTHYTHWFQPMTGLTAEKHDAFLEIDNDGEPIERFSGNELIQGEPDASSFPSGGMRTTFEARGYTMWDPSSPAFIVDGPHGSILCIPSVFISYNGEALDKKTPLLRSMRALDAAAREMLALFGRDVERVITTLGPEQEYFLIDKEFYHNRPDLIHAGRTLLGAAPPKGQEMEDHYFGSIKERVLGFMQAAEEELYRLGVPAKTRHNEVAPHQFEIAQIFGEANVVADRNQLVMEVLKKVAARHGFALLLHEKPFAGVNGSGKHLNWSITDSEGKNLLDPGKTPEDNLQFLVFLVAVLKAVYEYSDLLRASIASAGNDHRLGANEAPPAIMSVFLGSTLTQILDKIETGNGGAVSEQKLIDLGLGNLPTILQDNTDRNRTSPFAFTGNKFEFRAVGSSASISLPATILNAAVAEALAGMQEKIAARRKKGDDLNSAVFAVVKEIVTATKAVRFEGNNYAEEWVAEAAKRGLPNLKDTPAALQALIEEKNIRMLEKQNVYSESELQSRYNTKMEQFCKTIAIETETLLMLAQTSVLPAAMRYQTELLDNTSRLREAAELLGEDSGLDEQVQLLRSLSAEIRDLHRSVQELVQLRHKAEGFEQISDEAHFVASEIRPMLEQVRRHCDALEKLVPDADWPLPTYSEMLFIM